jgi:hypothetical protein
MLQLEELFYVPNNGLYPKMQNYFSKETKHQLLLLFYNGSKQELIS